MHHLRLALRLFRLRPAFCAAIVLTLGIGLGAATAIFSLVYALLVRPLPFATPDRLLVIDALVAGEAGRLNLQEYRDLEREARTLDGLAAYYRSQYNVTGGGPPEALTCTIASSSLFRLLGVRAVQGDIWPASQDFTRQYTVLISHRLWQQRFGSRPDLAGQTITLDGAPYRVAGVLPAAFDYPLQTDVFRVVTDYNAPHVRRYSVLARLRPGATLREAQAELDAFAARFAQTYPESNRGVTLRAMALREAYVGRARPFVLLMLGAVSLLLLIAATNAGHLLVSDAVGRRADMAVRLALGATRAQLVWSSIVEALVLAAAGALAGGLAARWTLPALLALVGRDLPPWLDVRMDAAVLLFSAVVTLATAVAIGAACAWQASGLDVERTLRQTSARTAGGRRQYRSRRLLVGAQALLASVLIVIAGVFVAGLRDLLRQDTGFATESLITFRVDPPYSRYGNVATTAEFYRRVRERLARLPGVVAVGANEHLPFANPDIASPRIAIEGRSQGRGDEAPFANFQLVDPGYFDAMRIRLLAGRSFEEHDALAPPSSPAEAGAAAGRGARDAQDTSPLVAVISERAALRFWGSAEAALGKRLSVTWNNDGVAFGGGSHLWLTVVGIVSNVRFRGLTEEGGLDVYATHRQLFAGDSYFVIRTAFAPEALRTQLADTVREVDPEQSIFDIRVMRERIEASVWQQRVARAVLLLFAIVALCLAIVGTYAVTAHAVAAQRRDIGIRLALGSTTAQAVTLVVRQWLTPVLAGAIGGSVAGVLLVRLLTPVIGVATRDLLVSAALPGVLIAAAAIACAAPVKRITGRLPLVDVLRAD